MSTAEPVSRAALVGGCGQCAQLNDFNAKFCGGCGHTLFERCAGCGQDVRLTEKFCHGCGTNLENVCRTRVENIEQTIEAALRAAKDHRYADAITRLELLTNEQDYRLVEVTQLATRSLEKVKVLRDRVLSRAAQRMQAANAAATLGNRSEAVRLLQSVPRLLLDEPSAKLLAASQTYIDEFGRLSSDLQTSLANHQWREAGNAVERLMALCPDDRKLPQLAVQIAAKLLASANRYYAKRAYDEAADCLDAIPAYSQDEAYSQFRQRIDHVQWLRRQFDQEPFATPTLGRLAVRLSQSAPDNPRGNQLATQLAACLKESSPPARSMFPSWQGSRNSTLGGEACMLAWPQTIDLKDNQVTRKSPGRFCVAIGLALQGLGEARVDQFLWQKKNLLTAITSRRKGNACWGIDIGHSGIRAVLLQREGARLAVSQAYAADYVSSHRTDVAAGLSPGCISAIHSMLQTINVGNTEVIANFSSRDVLARFLKLPPLGDKQANALLDAETLRQFPVSIGDLCTVRWLSPLPTTTSTGRAAAILAARKTAVVTRLDALQQAGLKVTGLQSDSLALVNFCAHEFASDWDVHDATKAPVGKSLTSPSSPVAAIAVIDAGAASTTLAVVDRVGFWFRLVEGGGEEMTSSLARSAKLVAADAERMKRDPASLAHPVDEYRPIEERQETLAARLKQLVAEPLKQNPQLMITQTWVVGGACLAHAWMRRVVCNSTDSSQSSH